MQYAEEDITLYRRTNDAFALRKGGAAHISDGSKASFGKSVSHFRSSLNKRTFAEPARSSHQGQNRNSARQSRGEAARRACYASPSRTACCSGIDPLAAIPLCGSPWRQPGNPARHIGPKALVVRAKCLLERRFFVHHHKDMKNVWPAPSASDFCGLI